MDYALSYEKEQAELNSILNGNAGDTVTKEAREAMRQRLEALNKYLASHITGAAEIGDKADQETEKLISDRKAFIENTRLAYAASHPELMAYLKDKGLSDEEIGYCCLYLLGLRSKEIGSYLGIRSHYNVSSAIRSKLGLDMSNANLGIYLRKLAQEKDLSAIKINRLDKVRHEARLLQWVGVPAEYLLLGYLGLYNTPVGVLVGVGMAAMLIVFVGILIYGLLRLGCKEMYIAMRMSISADWCNILCSLWICLLVTYAAFKYHGYVTPTAQYVFGYSCLALSCLVLLIGNLRRR